MIDISSLTKRYGDRTVVQDLALSVAGAEIYALLGPNGAGKSTTIGCVLGFVQPDAGSIRLAGSDKPTAQAAIEHAAYISENVALYDRLTGIENVEFFMRLQGRKPRRDEIEAWFARAGLPPEAWSRPALGYSKGMRQKVGIVMALAKEARVLVLDEPTSGLDPEASLAFASLIREVAAQGTAVLMATHDLFRAEELAHRCGMLVGGRLLGEWNVNQLAPGELERSYLATLREGSLR